MDAYPRRRSVRLSPMKRLRMEAGFTQREIAQAIGVSLPTVHRWEAGQGSPRVEVASRLAALLTTLLGRPVAVADLCERRGA
jgi:DNA-binding XRE family transcriptional regulator